MNNTLENMKKVVKKFINKQKKKIFIGIAGVVLLAGAATVGFYSIIMSNINHSVEEAQQIALKLVPGQVVRVTNGIELENLSLEYNFKIRNENNILMKVTVDAKDGMITEIDNYFD